MLEIYDEKPYYRRFMHMPCGSIAQFASEAGYGYRCQDCMAIIGSIGQPRSCKEEQEKYRNWAKLGGKDWEYFPDDDK
jgi:hypothetical protein